MRKVTKENLIVQIDRLYKIKDEQGQLSMSGEYTLQAYEILLAMMDRESMVKLPQVEQIGVDWDTRPEEYYLAADVRNALIAANIKFTEHADSGVKR